jgi:hypothetical protein
MVDVSQVNRRTGRDWPYTEKQMRRQVPHEDLTQGDYPTAGRTVERSRSLEHRA